MTDSRQVNNHSQITVAHFNPVQSVMGGRVISSVKGPCQRRVSAQTIIRNIDGHTVTSAAINQIGSQL